MRLLTALTVRVIVPFIIGCLALGLTSAILLYTTAPAWTDKIREVVNPKEYNAFALRANTKGVYVQEVLNWVQGQTTFVTTFARDLFRTDVNGQVPFNVARPYPSYFAAQLLDSSGSLTNPPLPADQSLVSQFYQNNVTTLAQFNAIGADNFTVLDDPFRAIYWNRASPEPVFQALQIGFENTAWRQYPYQFDMAKSNPRNQIVCNETWAPPQFKNAVGYVPNCRIWYTEALAAARASPSTLTTGLGPVIITSPYRSTTTGKIHITVAQAFATSGSVTGVFSIAVRVDTLQAALMRSAIVSGGYVFMIDDKGTVILYPEDRLNGIDIYARPTSVKELEFWGDQGKLDTFLGEVKASVTGGQGYRLTQKNGQEWAMSAAAIASTNFYVVVMAPTSSINALSNSLLQRVRTSMIISLVVQIILLVVLAALSYFFTRRLTQRILNPIHDLLHVLARLRENDLSVEIGGGSTLSRSASFSGSFRTRAVAKDIDDIEKSIRGLVIAVRFGNEAYYGGDVHKALRNYEAAEKLMRDMGNERGLGVCLNNKGNAYKQIDGEFANAEKSYQDAITNAEMLASREQDIEKKRGFQVAQGNRLANLGALYKDTQPLSDRNAKEAERRLKEAMTLHRGIDNMEGMAQAASNLGQLYITLKRIPEAQDLITDAYDFVKARGKDVPLQYVCMSRGMLAEANNKPEEAIAWYTYVLQRYKTIVRQVQRYSVERIINLCALPEINRPALAKTISEVAAPIFGLKTMESGKGKGVEGGVRAVEVSLADITLKHMSLVLDVSGSMSGSFIRTCRSCLTTILSEYVSDGDTVSFMIFDSSIRQIFPPTTKDPSTLPKMLSDVQTAQNNWGGTAFWDALLSTLKTVTAMPTKDGRNKWIIALTDGGDNASDRDAYGKIFKLIKNSGITIAVITVGPVPNSAEIRAACAASKNEGLFVSADASAEGIKKAFGKVVRAMTGWENVEFLE
ncbi:hypothetical protein HK097_005400 [Rhizophlyctis rosea]|uniref:VWFA domain-containing protein n=1 Tax=Rhizophlyctis rosea TaxID=64517 RepID=A0AAD5SEZ3_9FUNG|nr:hypothetical protein HK097_005400 [Rhizophlyctis rosea]